MGITDIGISHYLYDRDKAPKKGMNLEERPLSTRSKGQALLERA